MTKQFIQRAACLLGALLVVTLIVFLSTRRQWTPRQNTQGDELRIVSLAPSATEMLFAIDVGDRVVGVTNRCDYPPEAKRIESIGGFGAPSLEKLLALSPNLAVATGTRHTDAVAALDRAGIRTLWIKTGNFSEMFEAFGQLGREVGSPGRADEVVAAMRVELATVAKRYQDVPMDRRPRVFVEVWRDPITTAGKNSFVDDIITRSGGVNVAGELDEPYPTVNPEMVIEWNPDVIVLGYMGRKQPAEEVRSRIGWNEIAAVRFGRIVTDIPPELLLRPGPRLSEGVKALNARLYDAAGTVVEGNDGEGSRGHAR